MTFPQPQDYLAEISPFSTSGHTPSHKITIDLTTNQEPLGPSPQVLEIYKTLAKDIHIYPDIQARELRNAIANHYHIPFEKIVCGNGSEEFLYAIPRAYCARGDEVILSKGSFPVYKIGIQAAGAVPVEIPPQNLRIDVAGILRAITPHTKIIFIDNPGNPYSTYLKKDEVAWLVQETPPHVLIMLDGAYAEYVDAEDFTGGLEYVEAHPNVIVTRTFSKFYGLAGMRIGWAYGDTSLIKTLKKVKAPFNVGTLAQKMAVLALQDQTHAKKVLTTNKVRRENYKRRLEALGFEVPPSVCNFLTPALSCPVQTQDLVEHLSHQGIGVRALKGQGLPTHFRFSLSHDHDMEVLFSAIETFMQRQEAA